ncbi:septal ring lytic transglycosylase RlpA family protein [Pseudoalteromonas ruthenica]|uniref:septal ring lytic transglycosylase RlpA family protein n=1 Tax=Pseudoalteromonas ruthenica TaxID=151081 RepID=UPI00241BED82|nr:septal ring lytic transglycosylase RlpA family protein [Pseudoalteromonas ruthenica]|tara:strand:- start:9808 stop:10182 length:375 start_codon:yes stop_codon:yes gene_type:complete
MFRSVIAVVLLVVLSGCANHLPAEKGAVQQGLASYYHDKYHGRTTASGERFEQTALSAAHRNLPFGSKVKVTNTENGRSVVVRINDRGPFVSGRIIDLSRRAFKHISNLSAGVIAVEVEVLSGP